MNQAQPSTLERVALFAILAARRSLPTAAQLAGLAVAVAGVALLSIPAALIVAGIAVVAVVEVRS